MLQFYGDESFRRAAGSEGPYTLAGYLADEIAWKVIDEAWDLALRADPLIKYFKMHECWNLEGQFEGWKRADADTKQNDLVAVCEKYGDHLAWMDTIITHDCFDSVVAAYPEVRATYRTPYYFCLTGVVERVKLFLKQEASKNVRHLAPVTFVFDAQIGEDLRILRLYNAAKIDDPEFWEIVASLDFKDDKKCRPLQCADLLAWHVRRKYVQPAEDHGRPLPQYLRLRESVSYYSAGRWPEQKLKDRFELLKQTGK